MSEETTTVTVTILDNDYQVACPVEEVDELKASARELDKRMRDIRASGRIFGADRIAVMAALNVTHEYLGMKAKHDETVVVSGTKVSELTKRVEQAIAEQKQLNL